MPDCQEVGSKYHKTSFSLQRHRRRVAAFYRRLAGEPRVGAELRDVALLPLVAWAEGAVGDADGAEAALAAACVEIKFRTPHAIDATSSP